MQCGFIFHLYFSNQIEFDLKSIRDSLYEKRDGIKNGTDDFCPASICRFIQSGRDNQTGWSDFCLAFPIIDYVSGSIIFWFNIQVYLNFCLSQDYSSLLLNAVYNSSATSRLLSFSLLNCSCSYAYIDSWTALNIVSSCFFIDCMFLSYHVRVSEWIHTL